LFVVGVVRYYRTGSSLTVLGNVVIVTIAKALSILSSSIVSVAASCFHVGLALSRLAVLMYASNASTRAFVVIV